MGSAGFARIIGVHSPLPLPIAPMTVTDVVNEMVG